MKRILGPLLLSALSGALLWACAEPGATCDAPNIVCGDRCVDPKVDPDHCGACGNTCSANLVCADSACACPSGKSLCDGRCVDLRTDSLHCGACNDSCEAGSFCSNSSCSDPCEGDECPACPGEVCDDVCVDTSSDELNCGGCGIECGEGQHCLASTCAKGDLFAACFQEGQIVPFFKKSGERSGAAADGISGPQSLALLDDRYIVVAGSLDDSLYVIDRQTMERTGSLLLGPEGGQGPNHVLVRDQRAVVINSGVNTVQVIDLDDPSAPKTVYEVSTGEGTLPSMAAFGADGALWVSLNVTNQLVRVELGENAGTAGTPVDLQRAEGSNPFPAGVAVVDGVVYVALNNLDESYGPAGNGRLATYDIESGTTGLLDLGDDCKNPGSVAVDVQKIYVACTGDYSGNGAIVIVEGDEVHTIATGETPARLAVDPSRPGQIFAANAGSGKILSVSPAEEITMINACVSENEWEFVGDVLVAP